MNNRMIHRGPDAGAVMVRGPVALGHRRLSILDLSSAANQPMADDTGQNWIVFNGEIYNFAEIRHELEASGSRFRTHSDTEVILEAYRRWGADCLHRLNGMFAFAIWDERRHELFAARDRFGEKPFLFAPDGNGGWVFASEANALLAHPGVERRIDRRGLAQYLTLNYTLSDATLLEGVRKLPPAHFMVWRKGRGEPEIYRYWDLGGHFRNKRRHVSEAAAADELAELIDDSVRLRMVADVPIGAFLSGGIDSSTIAAAMSRQVGSDFVKTFSIGFSERSYSEVDEARFMADYLGVDHRDRIIDVDMATTLPEIVKLCDEPIADSSIIPVYFLADLARERVTVCLSGDGGDELLGGYETYVADKLLHHSRWLPRQMTSVMAEVAERLIPASFAKVSLDYKLKQFLRGHGLGPDRAHAFWRVIVGEEERQVLLRPEVGGDIEDVLSPFIDAAAEVADCHYLDRAMYVDIKTWLPNDILAKVDRATMAHSLEARAPFLDHRLAEFAASLPVDWKLRRFRTKHLLKEAQRRYLPGQVLDRKKRGFNAPVSHWFSGRLRDLAADVTRSGKLTEWVRPEAVDVLWSDHLAGRRDNGLRLFGLTYLGLWLDALGGGQHHDFGGHSGLQ